MRYKVVLLDMDGTVLDFKSSERASFFSAMKKNGIDANEAMYEKYTIINQRLWHMLENGDVDLQTLKVERFRMTLNLHQIESDCEKINGDYVSFLSTSSILLPGAMDFVKAMSASYLLCLITNGIHTNQVNRFRKSGLTPYIHTMVTSEEAGAPKPDPAVFKLALRRCQGLSEKDCLVIGDSENADILGARNSGMDALWYNPSKHPPSLELEPVAVCSTYNEILRFLEI